MLCPLGLFALASLIPQWSPVCEVIVGVWSSWYLSTKSDGKAWKKIFHNMEQSMEGLVPSTLRLLTCTCTSSWSSRSSVVLEDYKTGWRSKRLQRCCCTIILSSPKRLLRMSTASLLHSSKALEGQILQRHVQRQACSSSWTCGQCWGRRCYALPSRTAFKIDAIAVDCHFSVF